MTLANWLTKRIQTLILIIHLTTKKIQIDFITEVTIIISQKIMCLLYFILMVCMTIITKLVTLQTKLNMTY